jgi:hypothetical protein
VKTRELGLTKKKNIKIANTVCMFNLTFHFLLDQNSVFTIQCDQKENKSDQALQIIRNVVAEFYENKR